MRDRLIELLKKGQADYSRRSLEEIKKILYEKHKYNSKTDKVLSLWEELADYLLANGVIVPPKVTGEKVWYVCDGQVQFTLIEGVEPALRLLGFPRLITRQDIGTLIFLTREEAEQALKGDKDINAPVKAEKGGAKMDGKVEDDG